VEQFQDIRVREQRRKVWRFCLTLRDLHQVGIAISRRQLNQAEPIAVRVKAHGFRIDGHNGPKVKIVGQVALIEKVGHLPVKPLIFLARI
jgi:hypothetical protein